MHISDISHLVKANSKVAENYFFMTLLQVLNACFYLIIYPYLIRTLGAESYGLYTFAVSVVAILITLVNFGFDLPAAKRISQNAHDRREMEHTLSGVMSAKLWLEAAAVVIYVPLLFLVPLMRDNRLLFFICFFQTLTNIVFPQWYFQGIQRMRSVTFIQFGFKLLSLPFIFLLIHSPADAWLFMLISTAASLLGGFTAWMLIRFHDGLRLRLLPRRQTFGFIREATPFFLSNVAGIIKEQGAVIIIGSMLSMSAVAVYDLANKIVVILRTLLLKLNDALYPKVMTEGTPASVRRIIRYETFIGLAVIALVAAVGWPAVRILGGSEMLGAYPVAVMLSFTVLVWLVVGACLNFVFVPTGHHYWITLNQLLAMTTFFICALAGLWLCPHVLVLAAAFVASGLGEIIFCATMIRRHQLL